MDTLAETVQGTILPQLTTKLYTLTRWTTIPCVVSVAIFWIPKLR